MSCDLDPALPTQKFLVLVLGCGVYASTQQPAQLTQLKKLRGHVNAEPRLRIAEYLGVRTSGAECKRLRAAVTVCRQLEEEQGSGPDSDECGGDFCLYSDY